jgi:ubiquinone/menaquinone biosynthesis C-methylase UbiE
MKIEWDYSELAKPYLKRAPYSEEAIEKILSLVNPSQKILAICDVGAGTGNLTTLLSCKGHRIVAIEPNPCMRELGISNTALNQEVTWVEGTGEETKQPNSSFDLVSFGSSFNVTDRHASLKESKRILRRCGWFVCLWNHRNLKDPLQQKIEATILEHLPSYSYGVRREDQSEAIRASKLFREPVVIKGQIVHTQTKEDCIEAWKSHATLAKQAGEGLNRVLSAIERVIRREEGQIITIPYETKAWVAQLRD